MCMVAEWWWRKLCWLWWRRCLAVAVVLAVIVMAIVMAVAVAVAGSSGRSRSGVSVCGTCAHSSICMEG
jgi:hypothetical protein